MPSPEEYDLVILGSGEAGKYLAWTLAPEGKRLAVVERRCVGGSWPNIACLPSKNVIHSANWVPFVITDGRLVTGQNLASSKAGAEALLRLLA